MYSDGNSFEEILTRLLDNVDDGLDKREGSIIYDALAPAAAELANCYLTLDIYQSQTYLLTALGDNLDNKVVEAGISRIQSTAAQVIISVYDINGALMNVPIGSRFSAPNEYGAYNYVITENQSTGIYIADCETLGSDGNKYIGDLLPLQSINNLGRATITSIYKPGEDEETDEALRERTLLKLNQEAFAGNKAAYRQLAIDQDGVEDCKVFPHNPSAGYVKLAIVASDHSLPSQEFLEYLQTKFDPLENQGEGIGLAPIGHRVSVVSPEKLEISISATLTLDSTSSISQLQDAIEEQIKEYLYEVQTEFATSDNLTIYISRVIASILKVSQVKNVSDLTINNSSSDLTTTSIQYPVFKEAIFQ